MTDQSTDQSLQRRRAYDSDLTDEEWALVRPLVETVQTGPGPRRSVNLREVLNALLYKQRTGCQWRMLPHDLPPRSTVSGYYQRWTRNGIWDQINALLRKQAREHEGQAAPLSALVAPNELPAVRRTARQRPLYLESMG